MPLLQTWVHLPLAILAQGLQLGDNLLMRHYGMHTYHTPYLQGSEINMQEAEENVKS